MADVFGDDFLFAEFDRERDTQNIFIDYDKDESGSENRSRIVFTGAQSDSEDTDNEDIADQQDTGAEKENSTVGSDATGKDSQESRAADEKGEDSAENEESSGPQTTSYQEKFEKNKLRQFARIIDSTRYVEDDQSPGVQLIFHNNKFAKKYRSRIEQFIINLSNHADKKDFTKIATDLSGKSTAVPTCVDLNDQLPTEKRNNRMWQAHAIIGCAQFHSTFMVDTRGWPQDDDDPKECVDIPKYAQVFNEVFPPDVGDQPSKPPGKPRDQCFNCGGEHRLNECSIPKDHNRIREKRREHQDNKAANKSNPGRYHEDPELNPNRAKFAAGTISESLRMAIGLRGDQLPPYIYRMRMFGYPPGWLAEANKKASSLAMYDKDGRAVHVAEINLRGESLEDGEYSDQTSGGGAGGGEFDVNKIIEYPGFTVAVPEGFVDESDSKGMPPIQQHQLKKTLIQDMATREAVKKRRLEEERTESRKKLKKAGDKDVGSREDDQSPKSPTSPGGSVEEEGESKVKAADGAEEGASSPLPTTSTSTTTPEEKMDSSDTSDPNVTNGSSVKSASDVLREKNFSFSSGSTSLGRDFGTPILVRDKSFTALPTPDKFSVGVEDHIPFENLPDSVGTFEKMRNLFSLIKDKIKKPKK